MRGLRLKLLFLTFVLVISFGVSVHAKETAEVTSIIISPDGGIVETGGKINFSAEALDADGNRVKKANISWSVGGGIGSIKDNGLFTADAPGDGFVVATSGSVSEMVSITVVEPEPEPEPDPQPEPTPDPAPDPGPVDDSYSVTFLREKSNGKTSSFGPTVKEGDTASISGFPSPLNFLNGMEMFFPPGSLSEHITITIRLPGFVPVNDAGEAVFARDVLLAVGFEVGVNGVPVSPYRFRKPVRLTIPYRRPVLEKLGIDSGDLCVFYMTGNGELDGDGVTGFTVDTENDRIICELEYFNVIAVTMPEPVPAISIQPSSIDFGEIGKGESVAAAFEISNTGTGVLNITDIASDNPSFTVDAATAIIPPDESTTVAVTFTPSGFGDFTATISVTSDDPENGVVTVGTAGSCVGAEMGIPTESLTFGEVLTGESSVRIFDISNTGNRDLVIASIESGDPAFTVDISTAIIPPSETMTATVTFAPIAIGDYTAAITVAGGNPPDETGIIAVTGTAVGPEIRLSSETL